MIKHWHLKNFKSFRLPPRLELSRINVLAGANSSGKSSLIQSILLLKQTLQYGSDNRPITLNGPLLRVGAFDDVRNFEAGGEDLEIAFEIELTPEETSGFEIGSWARMINRPTLGMDSGTLRSLSLRLAYNQEANVGRGFPQLAGPASLTPRLKLTHLREMRVIQGNENVGFARYDEKYPHSVDEDNLYTPSAPYAVEIDPLSTAEVFSDKPDASISGGMISYFLPSWVVVTYNIAAQKATKLASDICNSSDGVLWAPTFSDETVPPSTIAAINIWLEARGSEPLSFENEEPLARDLRTALLPHIRPARSMTLEGLLRLGAPNEEHNLAVAKLQQTVLDTLLTGLAPAYDIELELPRNIRATAGYIREFFRSGVKYLGPLRDSPRPVYQPEALESTTDVGYRGEHTAAVLDLNASKVVQYYRPPSDAVKDDYIESAQLRRVSLHDAVVEWLVYLGVADDVVTTDAGVYGNRLQVSTDGIGRLHDLTNVGVGVSQVLPIVVMALLAPRGSLLIFEQPELHLHPKVQARLADFFIALALDHKQTLLETHSEYLVDRFRLRIALSQEDLVRPLINILFTHKSGGQSELTPVEISEFGAIINWPKDFFEQAHRDVGSLIKAAADKRRLQSKA